MADAQALLIQVDSRGLDDEAREALARSLAAELNEHREGAADLARVAAPPGSKAGERALTAEVAISLGALAACTLGISNGCTSRDRLTPTGM